MTPEERAREALLRCVSKPPWLEEYEPEIARAIREAVEAERERCIKRIARHDRWRGGYDEAVEALDTRGESA